MTSVDWDLLIIGRSYTGLSAALNLGRARRSVLVVGSGGARNDAVFHVHGLLTRDGEAPGKIIETAERQLEKYPTIELVDDRVTALANVDGGFRVSIGKRTSTAGMVILATGVNDNPSPIPGLGDHWGRGVFTCPYCDGFEHGDMHLVLTGSPMFVPHMARVLKGWSSRVTAFVGGLDEEIRTDLEAHGMRVDERPITRVNGDGNAVSSIELDDGTDVAIGALFFGELPIPNNALAVDLGCTTDENGYVVVDSMKRTTVSGGGRSAMSPACVRTCRWRSPMASSPPSTATPSCSIEIGTRRTEGPRSQSVRRHSSNVDLR